jgi:hypothetical protein
MPASQEWEEERSELVNDVLDNIFGTIAAVERLESVDMVAATHPSNEQAMMDLSFYSEIMQTLSKALQITGKFAKASKKTDESVPLEWLALGIGKLKLNLLGLEFYMRACLCQVERGKTLPSLFTLEEGETVEENALTNYDGLQDVIDKYNRAVAKDNADLKVGDWVVSLRHILAHGRIIAGERHPLTFYKFSKPRRVGEELVVEVQHAAEVTQEWLEEQLRRVGREVRKVHSAAQLYHDREKEDL